MLSVDTLHKQYLRSALIDGCSTRYPCMNKLNSIAWHTRNLAKIFSVTIGQLGHSTRVYLPKFKPWL